MRKIKVRKGDVLLAETIDDVENYFSRLDTAKVVIFDWETTGLEYNAVPLGIAFHQDGVEPLFVPIDYFFTKGLPIRVVVANLNILLKGLDMVAHNSKYDCMINREQGIIDVNIFADTLVMIHLYNPEIPKQLEKRVKSDFKYEKQTFESIVGKKWTKIDWAREGDELLDKLAGYAGEDAFWTTQLYNKYSELLDDDAWRVHDRIEIPFMWVLLDMKIRGVRIDVGLLKEMGKDVDSKLKSIRENIYREAGCVFNLNSPKQKQEVFYDKLKLPILKTTATGAPSTDSDVMEQFQEMGYPIGEHMVAYSELNKLNTGYIQSIPELVDSDNILRGDINSCGTATGRCSASKPNLQNQPNNKDFPIRKAFIPREGYKYVNYDYSQLELRVLAHMSKDEKFTKVFNEGGDPHGDVAERLHIPRKGAKTVNFGVIYGMGPQSLAHVLGITDKEAEKIISVDYMNTYTGVTKWKKETERFAEKHGYVKNLFGRVRKLPLAMIGHYGGDRKGYYGALRKAVNTIIQGTGADIVKLAMIQIAKKFKEEELDAHILLQVHDDVLVEASMKDLERANYIVKECMATTVLLDIPLDVDGKIISNWAEMKEESEGIVLLDTFQDILLFLLNN